MRSTILAFCIALFGYSNVNAQVFFTESFETESGWNLSHTFDNGSNKYIKRDNTAGFTGLEFVLFGLDGEFAIGAENTDANEPGAPESGIAILTLDDIDISGRSNLECVISLACNDEDQSYDDRTFPQGDFLDWEVSVDNGIWTTIGAFNAAGGSDDNSGLFHDANKNQNGGEIGENPVISVMTDYVLPINFTGNSLGLRALIKMDESAEEIVFDNVRLRENTEDDSAPTINHVELQGNSTLRVFFNESMSSSANITGFYTGISGLSGVTLENNNLEAVLSYSTPLVIGQEYNFVIFGPSDMAGNSMSGPYLETFYYNPTQPPLVVTEIMYNDPNNADSLEFIELFNNGVNDIQLGGIEIFGTISYTFPSTVLGGGEYLLIARKVTPSSAFYGETFGNYSGSLSNGGGIIDIRNTLGVFVDYVAYDNNLPWPPAGDGTGASIKLVDENSNNNEGANWVASTNGFGILNGDPIYASPGEYGDLTLPIVQFSDNNYAINETDGTVDIVINLSAANGMGSSVELFYTTASTGNDQDVTLTGSETINFSPGMSGPVTITLPIVDDTDLEGYETITIGLQNPINANIGFNAETNLLINDNEYVPPTLFINELQSTNITDVTDEVGEHEDWFEIYNPNNFSVDLAGYYFSDNALNPTKDRLRFNSASSVIEPLSHKIFWADENGSEGPLHMNFRLSSAGEFLSITGPDGTTTLDQIAFPVIGPDLSYGRISDGEFSIGR